MTETTITAEQIAAYQAQQEAADKKAQDGCMKKIVELADSHGYVILAIPVQVGDGRPGVVALGATWGLQRKAQ